MKSRQGTEVRLFVVMWAASTVIATSFVLALATVLLTILAVQGSPYGEPKILTSSLVLEVAWNAVLYDGPWIALLFGGLYPLSLAVAVGLARFSFKAHWLAFLVAGALPLVLPLLYLRFEVGPLPFIVAGILGATIGWLDGRIWLERLATRPPQQPA